MYRKTVPSMLARWRRMRMQERIHNEFGNVDQPSESMASAALAADTVVAPSSPCVITMGLNDDVEVVSVREALDCEIKWTRKVRPETFPGECNVEVEFWQGNRLKFVFFNEKDEKYAAMMAAMDQGRDPIMPIDHVNLPDVPVLQQCSQ